MPRFATNGKRVENRVELTRILASVFAERTTRDWVEALEAAGVPNGPINTIEQVFAEPQAIARGLRIELAHPAAGKVSLVAQPDAVLRNAGRARARRRRCSASTPTRSCVACSE